MTAEALAHRQRINFVVEQVLEARERGAISEAEGHTARLIGILGTTSVIDPSRSGLLEIAHGFADIT